MSKFFIIFYFPALLPVFASENETLICKIAKPSEHSYIASQPRKPPVSLSIPRKDSLDVITFCTTEESRPVVVSFFYSPSD